MEYKFVEKEKLSGETASKSQLRKDGKLPEEFLLPKGDKRLNRLQGGVDHE